VQLAERPGTAERGGGHDDAENDHRRAYRPQCLVADVGKLPELVVEDGSRFDAGAPQYGDIGLLVVGSASHLVAVEWPRLHS
jgi:hypothetical protein